MKGLDTMDKIKNIIKLNYLKDVYDIENNCNNVYNQSTESKDCI